MQRMRGFTVIELMVTIAVLGILVAIAAPSFRTMILNQQSEGMGEDIVTTFQLARSEAIKRGGFVTVCPSNDGTNCGGSWQNGLMVIVDNATTNTANITFEQDDRLRHAQFSNNNAVVNTTGPGFLRYNGSGMMVNSTNPLVLTAHVAGCQGERQRIITIGLAGMINVSRNECPEA